MYNECRIFGILDLFIQIVDVFQPTKLSDTKIANDSNNNNFGKPSGGSKTLNTSCIELIDLTSDPDEQPCEHSVIITPEIIPNNSDEFGTSVLAKKRKRVKTKIGTDALEEESSFASIVSSPAKKNKVVYAVADDNSTDTTNEMSYKCFTCTETFNRNSKLQSHMKTHKKVSMKH